MNLKYTPSFGELVDRLTIVQRKEIYGADKKAFAQEIDDIVHDLNEHIKNGTMISGEIIRAIIVLTQANQEIWDNEDFIRKGESLPIEDKANLLEKTHKLNGTRSTAKTIIQSIIGGRIDPKLNSLAAGEKPIWDISWKKPTNDIQ